MKNLVIALCLASAGLATISAQAADSYTTTPDEEGRYCARVKVQGVGYTLNTRKYCRTVKEWQKAGYEVAFHYKEETEQ